MHEMTDEAELVQQARAGELNSFNQLVEKYQGQVYNLSWRMLGNAQDAEDATQETFVLAWQGLPRFKGGDFKTWLLRIASNVCIDHLRANRRHQTIPLDELLKDPAISQLESPEDRVLREELAGLLNRCLLALPEKQRLVVILADVQGLSYEEIAQITGTSLGTVKSRLNRGRMNLRNLVLKQKELLPPEFRLNK